MSWNIEGEQMKKKLFLVLLFVIIFISIPISVFVESMRGIIIVVDLLILIFIYGYLAEKQFLKMRLPDLLNSERNFEKLLICDESHIKCLNKERTLVLSNYNRNFFVDFLILKRYYSFLRTDGECIFVFDLNNKKYFESKKINSLDYNFLHIVTIYENNIKPESKFFKIKKILNKFKIVIYKLGIYKIFTKTSVNINEIEKSLKELDEFARERLINVKILIKNIDNIEKLEKKYENIEFQKI